MDIPTHIDLSGYFGEIAYQGNEGTCAENAEYNALLYQTTIVGSPFKIDRQLSYQNVLDIQGTPTKDSGTVMPLLWLTGETKGLNSNTGIYGPADIGIQPIPSQVLEASTHKILSTTGFELATQTSTTVAEIVDMLNKDQPVILGFNLRQGFVDGTGINSGNLLGGHAVTVVGYDSVLVNGQHHDILKVASWGPQYGANGYFNLDMTASFGTVEQHRDILSVDTINGFNGINWAGDSNSVTVAELYNVFLNRAPETSAFANVSSWINNGGSLYDIANTFLASKECQKILPLFATNSDIVYFMFKQIQGRAPLDAGFNYWKTYLDNGGSKAQMAIDMIHQTEDTTQWGFNAWAGSNPLLRNASDYLYNRAITSIDIGLHMQDLGDTPDHSHLLTSVLTNVTADPNSVQVALVGIPNLLHNIGS